MLHGIYLIWKHEGFLSLYKGAVARILMHVPTTAISMGVTEYLRENLLKSQ